MPPKGLATGVPVQIGCCSGFGKFSRQKRIESTRVQPKTQQIIMIKAKIKYHMIQMRCCHSFCSALGCFYIYISIQLC